MTKKKDKVVKVRHYCSKCGAKRYEEDMEIVGRARYGKMSWACIECGDSRFKEPVDRSTGKMNFTIQSKKEKSIWRR